MDDSLLVSRAQQGDVGSFERLVHVHAGAIFSFLYRFLPNPQDVQDLTQIVFLKAFQNLSQFDGSKGKFRSWLFRMAATSSLDELKKRESESVRENVAAEIQKESQRHKTAEDRMVIESVKQAISALTSIERQVILLFYYHDLSYQEIADTLDIPLGTVKSRMHNAIARMRRLLMIREEGEFSGTPRS